MISSGITSFALPSGYLQTGQHYCWNMSTHNSAGSGAANPDRLYFVISSAPALQVAKIEALTPEPRDWDESVKYVITVQDSVGHAVANATVEVNDDLMSRSAITSATTDQGLTTYETNVPSGKADGPFVIAFRAILNGFQDSDVVQRTVQVTHQSVAPSISVASPVAGETWAVGTTNTIVALHSGPFTSYSFAVSRDGGFNWTPLPGGVYNPGTGPATLKWNLTGPASTQCVIRVVGSYNGGVVSAQSDIFTVAAGASASDIPRLVASTEQSQLDYPPPPYLGTSTVDSIYEYGCTLTCFSMILNGLQIPYVPPSLNRDVVQVGGFDNRDNLNLTKATPGIAKLKQRSLSYSDKRTFHYSLGEASNKEAFEAFVTSSLLRNTPVIIQITDSLKPAHNHYVLAVGRDSQGFILNDPNENSTTSNVV